MTIPSFNYTLGFGAFQPIVFTEATGGTVTTDGDYKVHTFNSSGTFEVTTLGDRSYSKHQN
jgi:hypothetical protein